LQIEDERRAHHPGRADAPGGHLLQRPADLRVEAIHKRLHHAAIGPFTRGTDTSHLVGSDTKRLLAENMLARLQRADCPLGVHTIRQRNIDRLDLVVGEQRLVARQRARAGTARRNGLRACCIAAGNRHQPGIVCRGNRRDDRAHADFGGAHHAPAHRVRLLGLLVHCNLLEPPGLLRLVLAYNFSYSIR
jgi:hypothetical protein